MTSDPLPGPVEVVVAGPTGGGKTALAALIARRLGGEIVSCDSVQVYRGFDIGSAKEKDLDVPQHLVDVADWREDFDAAAYALRAREVTDRLKKEGRLPVLAGGTGLYLRAYWGQGFDEDLPKDEGLRAKLKDLSTEDLRSELERVDPVRASEIHPNDRVRLIRAVELIRLVGGAVSGHAAWSAGEGAGRRDESFVIVLEPPRARLHQALETRTRAMLGQGLVEEVQNLLNRGVSPDAKPMKSIGYDQVVRFLQGEISEDVLFERILFATRQYAKRQCTWFRKVRADLRLDGTEDPEETLEKVRSGLALPKGPAH